MTETRGGVEGGRLFSPSHPALLAIGSESCQSSWGSSLLAHSRGKQGGKAGTAPVRRGYKRARQRRPRGCFFYLCVWRHFVFGRTLRRNSVVSPSGPISTATIFAMSRDRFRSRGGGFHRRGGGGGRGGLPGNHDFRSPPPSIGVGIGQSRGSHHHIGGGTPKPEPPKPPSSTSTPPSSAAAVSSSPAASSPSLGPNQNQIGAPPATSSSASSISTPSSASAPAAPSGLQSGSRGGETQPPPPQQSNAPPNQSSSQGGSKKGPGPSPGGGGGGPISGLKGGPQPGGGPKSSGGGGPGQQHRGGERRGGQSQHQHSSQHQHHPPSQQQGGGDEKVSDTEVSRNRGGPSRLCLKHKMAPVCVLPPSLFAALSAAILGAGVRVREEGRSLRSDRCSGAWRRRPMSSLRGGGGEMVSFRKSCRLDLPGTERVGLPCVQSPDYCYLKVIN